MCELPVTMTKHMETELKKEFCNLRKVASINVRCANVYHPMKGKCKGAEENVRSFFKGAAMANNAAHEIHRILVKAGK